MKVENLIFNSEKSNMHQSIKNDRWKFLAQSYNYDSTNRNDKVRLYTHALDEYFLATFPVEAHTEWEIKKPALLELHGRYHYKNDGERASTVEAFLREDLAEFMTEFSERPNEKISSTQDL